METHHRICVTCCLALPYLATSQSVCPNLTAHTTLLTAQTALPKPHCPNLTAQTSLPEPHCKPQDTYYFKPKRANDRGENEQRMLELFMKAQRRGEPIAEHAPEYHGLEARDGQPNFKMTNLIYDFVEPRLLDCKVGVRCHTESEATNAKLRTDLCERWRKMDPSVLTEEELERGSITKSRWMALRDSRSSTQRLGFRIDAVATPRGHKTAFDSELHSVREDQHVLETFRWFLPQAAECEGCHPREIAGEILVKLRRLETALRAWADFWHNEFIGRLAPPRWHHASRTLHPVPRTHPATTPPRQPR